MSTSKINSTDSSSLSDSFFNTGLFCNRKEISDYIWQLINKKNLIPSDVYKKADISKQNWSNYISGKNIPNPVNARKLVIGLECTLKEAEEFLALCGFQFVKNSKADECIVQCLNNHIFRMVDVYICIEKWTKKVA